MRKNQPPNIHHNFNLLDHHVSKISAEDVEETAVGVGVPAQVAINAHVDAQIASRMAGETVANIVLSAVYRDIFK